MRKALGKCTVSSTVETYYLRVGGQQLFVLVCLPHPSPPHPAPQVVTAVVAQKSAAVEASTASLRLKRAALDAVAAATAEAEAGAAKLKAEEARLAEAAAQAALDADGAQRGLQAQLVRAC